MLDPTPVLTYSTDLCNALTELGVDVVLLTGRDYVHGARAKFTFCPMAPPSVRGHYLRKIFDEIRYLSHAARLVLFWRPQIIHYQFMRFRIEIVLVAVLQLLRRPLVWTVHNVLPHETRGGDWLYYNAIYHMATRLFAHTEGSRTELVRRFHLDPRAVAVVPFGNYERLPRSVIPARDARTALGLPDESIVFLFYGMLRPYKGYDDLLDAFIDVAPRSPNAMLLIAGWASAETADRLGDRVAQLPPALAGRVRLHLQLYSFVSQGMTDQLFSGADVVVLPYRSITQSAVLFQAFSYGRPVLASAVGGFAETIIEGVNGYLVPPQDRETLAARIAELSRDRAALTKCGVRARERARAENDWGRIGELTRSLYHEALGTVKAGKA